MDSEVIELEQPDRDWLVHLSSNVNAAEHARASFLQYLIRKHKLEGQDWGFDLKQLRFVKNGASGAK